MSKVYIYSLLFFCLLSWQGHAQSVERQVFTPFGSSAIVGGFYLSATTGEPVAHTQSNGAGIRISGFQQPTTWMFVGVEEVNDPFSFTVFPNPSRDFVSVKSGAAIRYRLWDASGKVLRAEDRPALQHQIDLQGLPSGFYFIRVLDPSSGATGVRKLIKF